jgi:beta-phosphoglucomutase
MPDSDTCPTVARPPVLRAVIFDLDGVLVTTDRYHYLGWKRLAQELGMHFDEQDNHLLRGVSRAESLRTIYRLNARALPAEDEFERQAGRKNGYYVALIERMTPADVLPGTRELLAELRRAGLGCAIASSSRNAGVVLARTGLAAHIDAVADGNDISRAKPAPEVFLVAAAKLGVPASACVGVEDAAAGIESICRAGMPAVGIGGHLAKADLAVDSVIELNVGLLRELHARWSPPGHQRPC